MKETADFFVFDDGQSKEQRAIAPIMDDEGAMQYLASHGQQKTGNDVIFSWLARYQQAAAAGADAVNGTIGALLEDDGSLAVNQVVDACLLYTSPSPRDQRGSRMPSSA